MVRKTRSSAIRDSAADSLFIAFVYASTFLIMCVVLYPLLYVLSASLSSAEATAAGKVFLFPVGPSLEGYQLVFEREDILLGFRNTIGYTLIGTVINLTMTTLLAFPLSRREMPGRNLVTFFVAFTMFFSGGLIPSYLLVQKLGMVDTLWAMVVPNAISTFNMILMRTYFQTSIPDELLEAAYLDGCGYSRFLLSIVLPLSTTIIAVLILYYAVGHWNAYFSALIYLRSSRRVSLQLVLRNILLANQISTGGADAASFGERAMIGVTVKYAVIIVSSVPVIVLYPFIQRYFIKGIMIGAIKG